MSKKRTMENGLLSVTSLKKSDDTKNKEFTKKIINKSELEKIVVLLKYDLKIPFDQPLTDAQFQKLQTNLNLYMTNHAYCYEQDVVPMGDE